MKGRGKKVTICSSGAFVEEANLWKKILEKSNYRVIKTPRKLKNNYAKIHKLHYKKIVESDVVLVLNLDKNGVKNYIGPSVYAEIAFAIGLNITFEKKIKIFCLNPIPRKLPYSKELLLWNKLKWLKKWGRT